MKLFKIVGLDPTLGSIDAQLKLLDEEERVEASVRYEFGCVQTRIIESLFLHQMLFTVKENEWVNPEQAKSILQYILCEIFGDSMWYEKVEMCRMDKDYK